MLKRRQVTSNGKSVVPIYPSFKFSSMSTIPTRIAQKYNLKQSHVIIEERGDGGLFIKRADSETRTKTFLTGTTGKHSSCGLLFPYIQHTNTDMRVTAVMWS